jgi:hypothetical protein
VIGDEPARTGTTPNPLPGPTLGSPLGPAGLAQPLPGQPASPRRARPQRSGRPAPPRPRIPTGTRPRARRAAVAAPPTRLDLVRRVAAVLAVLVAVVLIGTGAATVCADTVTGAGNVVRTCRAPEATDGLVIGWALFILLLLSPDLAELGVPGLFTLRRRVDEQEGRLDTEEGRRELLETQIAAVSAQLTQVSAASAVGVEAMNIYLSGDETADYAAAERLPAAAPAAGPTVVVDRVSRARYTAADLFIRRMRAHPGGALDGSSIHLYLPDETGLMLVPAFEADRAGRVGTDWWQVGQGIVGRAWRDGEALSARGEEIMHGLVDLPAARRQRYAGLAAVVAVPVMNALRRPIAVLSASATDPATRLDSPEGIEALVTHADAIARVIVDLLGWESDAE